MTTFLQRILMTITLLLPCAALMAQQPETPPATAPESTPAPATEPTPATPEEIAATTPETPAATTPEETEPPPPSTEPVPAVEPQSDVAPALEPSTEPTPAEKPTTDKKDAPADKKDDSEEAAATPEKPKRSLFVVTWNLAAPLGTTRTFIDKFSFEGVGFEYRFQIRPDISVGLLFAWNTFEQEAAGTFNYGNVAVSGKRVRLFDAMPLCASFHYNVIREGKKVVPFVGLDVGTMFTSRVADFAWWYRKKTAWHFSFAPEIGLRLTKIAVPLYASVKFNYAVKSGDMPQQTILNFNLGIAWSR